MGEANKILRSSIRTFFHGYHSFMSVASILVLPVSTAILLSQALITYSPYTLQFICARLRSLFNAAAFPATSSHLFSLLNLMLSQTFFSTIFSLPFTLTFLLLAKAAVILITRGVGDSTKRSPLRFSSLLALYRPLLATHLFNSFVVLSANAAIFALLFLLFSASELVGLSSYYSLLVMSLAGAVVYSVVIANTVVTCNLAIVVSAMENCSGHLPALRACMLIRGRIPTALSLALPTNLALAAVEALFQYRVMRPYHLSTKFDPSVVGEAVTIAYMHSVLTVIEIIASCLFYRSCKSNCHQEGAADWYHQVEMEPEDKGEV